MIIQQIFNYKPIKLMSANDYHRKIGEPCRRVNYSLNIVIYVETAKDS